VSLSRIWPSASELDSLLAAARAGSDAALGQLLERCRDYLLFVASRELGYDLRGKLGASDLVQETFVQAQRAFERFHGESESEMLAWLRRILLNQVLMARRHYGQTQKRELSREVSYDNDSYARELVAGLAGEALTPTTALGADEEARAVEESIRELPAEYQQVILLRNWDELTFDEIGQRIGRSAGAARKLWVRALKQLKLSEDRGDDRR
jgi:RNA polymerase sigma-70 factor, ECF subfamily